ncbi:hypothetical protein PICSAR6_04107 [Mycobacterium avium subsp. paratuberculosis]|nr:hypothetical protein PICSAR6_04107 [Mycobacterium avium subsp. paratuberculosis]
MRVVLAAGSCAGRGSAGAGRAGRDGSGAAGWVGSCGGRGAAATRLAATGGRAGRPLRVGRLRSSGRSISPSPILFCSRRAQRGAHQQSSPSSFITEGTRNIRTTVASSSSAAIRPKARYFISTRSENTNELATTASTMAAAVISRPVVAVPIRMASAVDMPRSRASTIRETRNTS